MTMRLRAEVSIANTDNGLVLLDERAGRYWQLNPTGALVLHLLLDGMTPHQVAQTLADRHPVSTDHQCTVHTWSPYDVSTKDLCQVLVQRVTLFGRLRHAGVPVWIDGQGIQALNACLAKDVGRLGNEPLSLLEALRLYCPDVALRVLVAGIQVADISMIGLEFQELLA